MSESLKPFICVCAIWNHRQEWTENLIQLFLDQDYKGFKALFLIDDRPVGFEESTLINDDDTYITVVKEGTRFPCLPCKYDAGMRIAEDGKLLFNYDDVYMAVLDDDDLYLPHYLSDHADVLAHHPWSYPEQVFSSYAGRFNVEQSGGRFWTSSAYHLSSLEAIGGYGDSKNMAYDQAFLDRMQKQFGKAGSPKRPNFVYNWDVTLDSHVSAEGGAGESDWYDNCKPSVPTGPLVPRYNEVTVDLLKKAKEHPLCV
jgi:hypothetical protein